MSIETRRSLDAGEFLERLYWEVVTGISVALEARGVRRALQIARVRITFGFDPTADRADGIPPIADPILPVSTPWEIDVTMEPGRPPEIFEMTGAELVAQVARRRRGRAAVASPLSDLPVRAIQGVGAVGSDVLGERGIDRIGQLAELDDLSSFGSQRALVLEFRTKARLALSPMPLLMPSPADTVSLYALAQMSPDELFRLIGKDAVSPARCEQLSAQLSLLMVALDDQELKKVPLSRFVEVA